jgi:hypothetical protein
MIQNQTSRARILSTDPADANDTLRKTVRAKLRAVD